MGQKNSKKRKKLNYNINNEINDTINKDNYKIITGTKNTPIDNNIINKVNEDNDSNTIINNSKNNCSINFKVFKTITNNAPDDQFDSSFILFKSIDDIFYLIFSNSIKSIVCYNLLNFQIINEIKNAHNNYITNFRHFYDKNNLRDLILSASSGNNNIKIWIFKNWECIFDLININKSDFLFSACFLNYENQLFILSTNYKNGGISDPIKVFDLEGNEIKEINKSKECVLHIDTYYEQKTSTYFIVTANEDRIISYNYNKNDIYFSYKDNEKENKFLIISHYSFLVKDINKMVKIIESCWDSYIRIWEFHSGKLINKIKLNDNFLNGVNLIRNKYLLVGCRSKRIIIIDLNNLKIINELVGHSKDVISIKTINHSKYGECVISKGYDGQIIFWVSNNYK